MATVVSLRANNAVFSGVGTSHVVNVSVLQSGVQFSGKVKTLIKSRLYEGCPDIYSIAGMLCVSVRTLQRKLALTGLTYSEMVQQARYEEASKMLIDGDTKIIDIAYELGYEDPSNFSRAFRRFAGASPCEFRARAKLMQAFNGC